MFIMMSTQQSQKPHQLQTVINVVVGIKNKGINQAEDDGREVVKLTFMHHQIDYTL